MRRSRAVPILATAAALAAGMLVAGPPGTAAPTAAGRGATGAGAYVLTATDRGSTYAPTFTGNGYLGVRVPPAGQGYAAGTVPAQSEAAGFYAQPPNDVQQRANIPTWSTLGFSDGPDAFSLTSGTVTGWRQQIDLHDGVITTTAHWHAPDGRVTKLTYQVFTDRARKYVAAVRLTLTPTWSGRASVSDVIDGTPANLTSGVTRGWDAAHHEVWESVRTVGTGLVAGLASRLVVSAADPTVTPIAPSDQQSVGQRAAFAVRAGRSYTVTKYVGVATSTETGNPLGLARSQAAGGARAGFRALHREDRAAWGRLWAGRVDVLGNPTLATEVNASQFYLWSSTRSGLDWSISPAGLSSNGYDGHIFWDAETWMYPSLLAQHPSLAAGMNAYRYQRLTQARQHAAATGYRGARYPWESALDGTEQIPPPVSINSEGLYEQHITSDIALAQWQYYVATGNRGWLRTRGWPVLSAAAAFWASRVTRTSDGRYHLLHVTGPDEENPDVNDEAYTNVAAATTLRLATAAARALGRAAPPSWSRIAAGLVVPVANGIHPEFAGYQGQLVKQADVTMLQYPWARPMSATVAQRDLNYYVPRSDPGGPSMDDAINTIDTSALNSPGCASYVYTQRSIEPFMRDVFDQFSETRDGGAFTFMTGIGGFLQEFLYGYSGLRLGTGSVGLAPSLTAQLSGIVLHRRDLARAAVHDLDRSRHDPRVARPGRAVAADRQRPHADGPQGRAGHDRDPASRHVAVVGPGALHPRRRLEFAAGCDPAGRRRRQPGDRLAACLAAGPADRAALGPALDRSRHPALGPDVAARAGAQRSAPARARDDRAALRVRPAGEYRRSGLAHRGAGAPDQRDDGHADLPGNPCGVRPGAGAQRVCGSRSDVAGTHRPALTTGFGTNGQARVPGSAGTSTACSRSTSSGTTASARRFVDASTTGQAAPSW